MLQSIQIPKFLLTSLKSSQFSLGKFRSSPQFPIFSRKIFGGPRWSPVVPGGARVVAARGRAARLAVAVAQLRGAAIEVVPDR